MPPTSTHPASSSLPTVFATVNVTFPPAISTTTATLGGATSAPSVAALVTPNASQVPIAAIAGGTAAGVVLALAAVIGWTWWGVCIKRRQRKERKEALAHLEVRENTRQNSSTLKRPANQVIASFSTRNDRKVTFASTTPSSAQSALKGVSNPEKTAADVGKSVPPIPPITPAPPVPPVFCPPSPTEQCKSAQRKEEGPPPPVPRRNPRRIPTAPLDDSHTEHRLLHQRSTLSTASEYSTQSATEERQSGVPASLLLALTSESDRRSLLANYLPWNRTSTASGNRLSEYSTGSRLSQLEEPIGFAYSGEDELPRR